MTKALDVETEAKTEAAGFETEAEAVAPDTETEAKAVYLETEAVASEICEIPRNSLKIQTYKVQGHPRSSILLGVNRKRICDFLLVTNSNFRRISCSFRDIDTFSYKIACFPHPTIV